MRITFQYQSLMYQDALRNGLSNLLTAADKVNKERLLLNPESSPISYVSAYNLQRMIDDTQQFKSNAKSASSWLTNADNNIQKLIKGLSDVRNDLALNGANGVNDLDSMRALAGGVLGKYYELFDIANSQYMGRYIFGGHQTEKLPFQDKDNTVTGVSNLFGNSGSIDPREVYSDMEELEGGEYSVQVNVKGDTGYLKIFDKFGREVLLDSNGSDDTMKGGNSSTTEMTFKVEEGAIVNTGRGISIEIPKGVGDGFKSSFRYEAGSDATYYGDLGAIYNKIGFNQKVPINITGRELFLQNTKILKSTYAHRVNGMPATSSTLFKNLDRANAIAGDSITIKGTDHLGRPVGSASVLGTDRANLNLLNSSKEERTFTIGFAGSYYEVEIPAKGYKDTDELIYTINRELKSATYVGAQELVSNYPNKEAMEQIQNAEINSGLAGGGVLKVDLSGEMKVIADGDRLSFHTNAVGDNVTLSVTGMKNNSLGFNDKTVASFGKDVVFEVGNDFKQISGVSPVSITTNNITLAPGTSAQFIVNGKTVKVDIPADATTKEDIEFAINGALKKSGFGFTVSSKLESVAGDDYNVTFTLQNINYTRDTHLAVTAWNSAGDMDYQMSAPYKFTDALIKDKSLGDFTKFIEELYGQSVKVSLEDGQVVVQDLRSGDSKLSMDIKANNEGISLAIIDQENIVTGQYNGSKDQRWQVNVAVDHQADGSKNVKIDVKNELGQTIRSETRTGYVGDEIELGYGVKIVVDDMGTDASNPSASNTFRLELKGKSATSFGAMAVAQKGGGADVFTSFKNIYDALYNGIGVDGRDAPSAWRDDNLNSTAIPYLDGVFGGNFNSQWKYEILSSGGKSNQYMQSEFVHKTGSVNYRAGAASLNFDIHLRDNTTGEQTSLPMTVDLTNVSSDEELAVAIQKQVTDQYGDKGIRVVNNNGKMEFESGSGSRNIIITPADADSLYMIGQKDISVERMANSYDSPVKFDYNYFDSGSNSWQKKTVSVGPWTDTTDAINQINAQLGADGTATISEGKLQINASGPMYYDNVSANGSALGVSNYTDNYISGTEKVRLDMTALDSDARSLTFHYTEGGIDKYAKITIPAKNFDTMEDLILEVDKQLTAEGLGGKFKPVAHVGGRIAFEPMGGISGVSIEGDNKGSLGFPHTGDRVTVAVTDEKGRKIANVTMDTANQEYHVSDGVLLGFDKGSLVATDNFTANVGSGIDYELGILDKVESQMLQALTKVGNWHSRVESVTNFHSSVILSSEDRKAQYLGSTEVDKISATTQYALAEAAYQYSMSITTRIMNISILDFLR